jgi:geranylgeranyl pyrophosphate synthase
VASAEVGASCAGASSQLTGVISSLAEILGLMFQIRDDILDVEGESGSLGKTAGKDAAAGKLTYPGVYGLDDSKTKLRSEHRRGLELVAQLPTRHLASAPRLFTSLLDFLAERGQ